MISFGSGLYLDGYSQHYICHLYQQIVEFLAGMSLFVVENEDILRKEGGCLLGELVR